MRARQNCRIGVVPGFDVDARNLCGSLGPRHSNCEREIVHAQSFAQRRALGKHNRARKQAYVKRQRWQYGIASACSALMRMTVRALRFINAGSAPPVHHCGKAEPRGCGVNVAGVTKIMQRIAKAHSWRKLESNQPGWR